MIYTNPVIKGFYPDPSVCKANGKYYMVCSSFQYFPGVPLFESEDLVNWKQIGHVLTRKSQVMLDKINSSGGVFAPTIRYNNGRFYMVTTNNTTQENFYVYTDDIYGEWSEPVTVAQGGIDPSLYFEDGRTYFMSNGSDDDGVNGVTQCEINVETGEKLSGSRCIWHGAGGRFLESPHLYKIGSYYYLMAAEGGTEYGHMITYGRAENVWGPFENYAKNPVLTNRNKAPFILQGIGHGDLVEDYNGEWHIFCLGFRQIHPWMAYHNLGREVCMIPVRFGENGWFTAGEDGTCAESYELAGDFTQHFQTRYTLENTDSRMEWCYLRHPHMENYEFGTDSLVLHGTGVTLDDTDSPTFVGLRQRDFRFVLTTALTLDRGEAGVTVYMCEEEHYEVALRKAESGFEAVLKLNIGGIKHVQSRIPVSAGSGTLRIEAGNLYYHFYFGDVCLGSGQTKYLTSEVSGGFTGVIAALYAVGNNTAVFTDFSLEYGA